MPHIDRCMLLDIIQHLPHKQAFHSFALLHINYMNWNIFLIQLIVLRGCLQFIIKILCFFRLHALIIHIHLPHQKAASLLKLMRTMYRVPRIFLRYVLCLFVRYWYLLEPNRFKSIIFANAESPFIIAFSARVYISIVI
jgi:hypothetical protein